MERIKQHNVRWSKEIEEIRTYGPDCFGEKSNLVKNQMVKSNLVKNQMVKSNLVKNQMVKSNLVKNQIIPLLNFYHFLVINFYTSLAVLQPLNIFVYFSQYEGIATIFNLFQIHFLYLCYKTVQPPFLAYYPYDH